nr:hypothetical protein [Tanacetum cinerariifolium]
MDLLRLIEQDSLSLEEKIIILLRRSENVVSLVIEWIKGVKIGGRRWGTSTRSTIILIIISLNLIWSESDILAFDGVVQLDSVQLKKSMNIVGSRKIQLIHDSALVNTTIFDWFIELSKDGRESSRRKKGCWNGAFGNEFLQKRGLFGNYIPPKHDQMFIDEQVGSESMDAVYNVSSSAVKAVESKVKPVD